MRKESRMKSLVAEKSFGILSGLTLDPTQKTKPYTYKTKKRALQIYHKIINIFIKPIYSI